MADLIKSRAIYGSKSYREAKELKYLTLKELRELAEKRGITISKDASRKEIISTLIKPKRD